MKVLKNAKFTGNIKINDTNTDIYFQAYDDGVLQKLNAGQCSFRIKNDTGYLITISNISTETDYITFKSNELKSLPVGTYYLELWVEDDTGTYIYPDESFCKLRINENVTVAQGTTIPTISLDEYESKLQGYVDTAVADGTQKIENDFDKYVDSITDSTIAVATKASQDAATAINTANSANAAAQNATNIANAAKSNADAASQNASTALDTANTAKSTANNASQTASNAQIVANEAKSTADTANSAANAANSSATDALNKANSNANSIQSNSDSINGGLYLDRAKSYAQINSSKNLVINSEMQSVQNNEDPYGSWHGAWGWSYLKNSYVTRTEWDGIQVLQLAGMSADSPLLSTGICAGSITDATVYSARFHYEKYGNYKETTVFSVYLEYAYQSSFINSQKVLIGEVTASSETKGFITKNNILVPQHMDWIRLRVEVNEFVDGYIFFGQPMVNYGTTIQDYVISDMPGQRIAEIESDIADLKSQIQALKNQLSGNN